MKGVNKNKISLNLKKVNGAINIILLLFIKKINIIN